MNYFYTFIKADQSITVSGSGNDPKDIQDIKWTSSPGAVGVLEQMDNIKNVYSPTIGFVSIDAHENNLYVHIAKFNNIYKDGWRFENSNLPAPASNSVEKAKTKQRVLVPASAHHKAYYRMQNVGSEATAEADNIWDITAKEFNILMSSTRDELREAFIYKFRSSEYEPHHELNRLINIMPDFMGEMFTPDPISMFDLGYNLHEMAVTDALDYSEVSPRVLKDYPDLAKRHNIDISDEAIAAAPPLPDEPTALHDMGKDQYDAIIAGVRKDYDRSPESVSDTDLEREYGDQLKVVDKAAKTRKQVYDNMPQHMQLGCTPDTMTSEKHYEGVILAAKNNKDVPTSVKEQYPMIFKDTTLNFAPTNDPDTNSAVNEVLTDIRDKLGDMNYAIDNENDRFDYRKLLKKTIKEIIGATGENVPTYLIGMEPEEEAAVSKSVDRLSNFLGPKVVAQMKSSGYDVNIIYNKFEDRPYCTNGNITLNDAAIRRSNFDDSVIVDDETIMHEYGHSIEHYAPNIQSECHDFLTKRTEGERLVMLSDAVVNSGYDSDEYAHIDNFKSAYIGKRYATGSTEILSMGMGYLGNEYDTAELMMEDPEYLGFVIATAAGKVGLKVTEKMEKAESDKYFYTYIKDDEFIRVSGNGEPNNLIGIKWTSSPGAAGALAQINSIDGVYTPIFGFVSSNDYRDDIYVQIAKLGAIYKNGWRFGATNLPDSGMAKSEVLAKGKTKKSVYVKGSGKRKPYWRVQEVGREEIDPKKIENIWDITLDQFVRLVSGDKQLLKERYIDEHRYNDYEEHPVLKDLLAIAPDNVRYNNEGRLSFFDDPDVNIHTKSIYQTLRDGGHVPAYVLKDYPDVANDFGIDISDMAIEQEATFIDDTSRERITNMPKAEYDSIVNSVKAAYDRESKHITDKMLKQDYEEELEDCKRSAKLRKRLFNKLPEHMQYGYTPDTIDARLHKTMVTMAHKYNIEIPTEVKAGYPTIYADMPFSYESTGNAECDAAANDILTQLRAKLGTDADELYNHVKISKEIYDIIGATGESVPTICGAGIDTKDDQFIAENMVNEVSASLISPGLLDQIKSYKRSMGPSRVMLTLEEGIRANQSGGVIHLSDFDRKTFAHEYGHAIDWMIPEINELSQAFLNNRTEGDPLIRLSEIVPWGQYGPDEVTRPDNFMSPYIGKHYDHSSSEVLSMGMGYMMSSEDMMNMYEQDPEYLGYIVAVLSGRARGAKVTKGPWSGSDEPANKSETIEIDISKLLNTTGLTQKRVLVRKKGGAPFWSTRWVQQGDTVKDTVEAAGYELVDESEDPDKQVSVADLVVSAYAAGKAAFERGLPNRYNRDSELAAIVERNPGDIKDKLNILEGWAKGWNYANATAPVPGVFDEPEPRKPTGFMTVEDWGRVGTVTVNDLKAGDVQVLDGGMERTVIALRTDRDAAVPSKTVIFGPFSGAPAEVGDTVVSLRNDFEVALKEFVHTVEQPDNFDTMPDVEGTPEPTVDDKPKPDIQPDTPTIDRVTGTKSVGGWSGARPAMKVSDLQVGDIQLFNMGVALKIIGIRRSGKSYILTHEDYINEATGEYWETKKQGRGMVGVLIPDNFDTMPDPKPDVKKLTVADVKIPAYRAGEEAFKRGVAATHGGDDPELLRILESLSHLPDDKKFKVLENWLAGWTNAELKAKEKAKPDEKVPAAYGVPLADRLSEKIKMDVPGVGIVPAIAVKDIQIGDRLQFAEGVYKVKGVIVKGASSIIIFHEKDADGNELKLKKQNRTAVPVERTQLTPGGYVQMPETAERKLTPFWAMRDEKEEALKLITTTGDFVPSKTVGAATDRLRDQFLKDKDNIIELYRIKTDISLDGLKLSQLNSIINGFERTIGKYNVKLDHIGWNEKKQRYAAMYTYLGDYRAILFQKTATKGQKAHQKKTLKNFDIGKDRNLSKYEGYLAYDERYPGSHDDLKRRIAKLEKLECWTVDSTLDDPILGLVVHEGHHAIYEQNKLRTAWYANIKELVGPKLSNELKCATVSEYGMSQMGELFAEVGVAVEFGVEIDPDVKQAYIKTMETIK